MRIKRKPIKRKKTQLVPLVAKEIIKGLVPRPKARHITSVLIIFCLCLFAIQVAMKISDSSQATLHNTKEPDIHIESPEIPDEKKTSGPTIGTLSNGDGGGGDPPSDLNYYAIPEGGDSWTENTASSWGSDNFTLSDEGDIKYTGSYSINATATAGEDNRVAYYNASKNLSLDCENYYEYLNFAVYQSGGYYFEIEDIGIMTGTKSVSDASFTGMAYDGDGSVYFGDRELTDVCNLFKLNISTDTVTEVTLPSELETHYDSIQSLINVDNEFIYFIAYNTTPTFSHQVCKLDISDGTIELVGDIFTSSTWAVSSCWYNGSHIFYSFWREAAKMGWKTFDAQTDEWAEEWYSTVGTNDEDPQTLVNVGDFLYIGGASVGIQKMNLTSHEQTVVSSLGDTALSPTMNGTDLILFGRSITGHLYQLNVTTDSTNDLGYIGYSDPYTLESVYYDDDNNIIYYGWYVGGVGYYDIKEDTFTDLVTYGSGEGCPTSSFIQPTDDYIYFPINNVDYADAHIVKLKSHSFLELRLYDSDSNYFYRTVDITTPNTWQVETIELGSGSSGWSEQGSPNWNDIDYIGFYYNSSQINLKAYIDNIYFDSSRTFAVASENLQSGTITPSYTTGIDSGDISATDGDSFTATWDTDHWEISEVNLGSDTDLDFIISEDFEGHNTTLSFSNWLCDQGVSITNVDPSHNERVDFETVTVKCTATQLSSEAATISSVKFRYTYESQITQYEVYSAWQTMSLESGNTTTGVYEGSFEVNSTFFDEDDDYKLQIRAENTNGLTEKETITFFADSTPENGLQLGSLHEPEEVKCGNVTEDLMFWCTATIHESQLVYTKTLSNSFKEKLGDDFDLVTAVAVSTKNVTNLKFKAEGSKWKLTLEFDEAPTEDASFKIYFYETEPKVSSPAVVNADNNKAVYTMNIDTQIARENVSIIGIDLPSIRKLYWAGYTTDSIKSWKIYTDSKLQNEISSAASATLLDYLSNEESGYSVEFMPNDYEGTISIYGINIEPDQTLYLVGYVKEKTYTLTIEPFIYALSISIIGIVVVQSTKDVSRVKKFYQKYAFYVYTAIFGAAGVTLAIFLFLPQLGGVLSLTDISEWSVTFRKPAINLASPVFAFVPITVAIVVILWSHVAKAGPVYESYRKHNFQWHIGLISGGGLFSLLIAVAGSIGALNVAEAPVEVQMLTQFGVYGFFTFIVIFGIILLRYFKGDRRRFR